MTASRGFGITTGYHYLFVPLTISPADFTAGLETAWVRSTPRS
ncbi:hypothetical protein ACFWD7_39960 [Streptomyces mirabilis]|nr:hypothetical protein [Streptomyces mirabilis]